MGDCASFGTNDVIDRQGEQDEFSDDFFKTTLLELHILYNRFHLSLVALKQYICFDMWTATLLDDPLNIQLRQSTNGRNSGSVNEDDDLVACRQTHIALATCLLSDLLGGETNHRTILQGESVARIALADYVARTMATDASNSLHNGRIDKGDCPPTMLRFEPLDVAATNRHLTSHGPPSRFSKYRSTTLTTPFILERTDVAVVYASSSREVYELHLYLRVFVYASKNYNENFDDSLIRRSVTEYMSQKLDFSTSTQSMKSLMSHIAVAVLQDQLRSMLHREGNAVAFVSNGAILPRKSGASTAPMASPPAIPFASPDGSPMNQYVEVDIGPFSQFLADVLPPEAVIKETTVSLRGLIVPRGVTLIVGGGYHGKSTLLRCVASGVYNKVPGDGREFCVTVDDAVTVRAEDGRYVSNCNVSAFISNLPTASLDTQRFSTGEASGSTSQASNVVEAIEMGVSAILVDEDVSAANFMARDGRMRSLVMDESITPLLYRVNGLYGTHGISSIVVVGGVGDWLDVPNNVILMDRYQCHDATAKARSISKQFSHGHVQYAGRGVVHRLQWDKSGTPIPRRPVFPVTAASDSFFDVQNTVVTLLDGSNSISLRNYSPSTINAPNDRVENFEKNFGDEEEQYIDMSRCEQLMGKKPQLYGCGLCIAWLLRYAEEHPELGMRDLLHKLDDTLDESGLLGVILKTDLKSGNASAAWKAVVETLGYVYRPRRFEVGQALTRFRGIALEAIPIEDDGADAVAKAEAERQRNELIAIWNNRRKRNPELQPE